MGRVSERRPRALDITRFDHLDAARMAGRLVRWSFFADFRLMTGSERVGC
jgi:hypothetical protein